MSRDHSQVLEDALLLHSLSLDSDWDSWSLLEAELLEIVRAKQFEENSYFNSDYGRLEVKEKKEKVAFLKSENERRNVTLQVSKEKTEILRKKLNTSKMAERSQTRSFERAMSARTERSDVNSNLRRDVIRPISAREDFDHEKVRSTSALSHGGIHGVNHLISLDDKNEESDSSDSIENLLENLVSYESNRIESPVHTVQLIPEDEKVADEETKAKSLKHDAFQKLVLSYDSFKSIPRNQLEGISLKFKMLHVATMINNFVLALQHIQSSPFELRHSLVTVIEYCCKVLHTENAIIYLYDENTKQLYTFALGNTPEIRVSINDGLVGNCFRTGVVLNIMNVNIDLRYSKSVDTGGVSLINDPKSILSIPIFRLDNNMKESNYVAGVLQLINKGYSGARFNQFDEMLGQFFAQHCALLLHLNNNMGFRANNEMHLKFNLLPVDRFYELSLQFKRSQLQYDMSDDVTVESLLNAPLWELSQFVESAMHVKICNFYFRGELFAPMDLPYSTNPVHSQTCDEGEVHIKGFVRQYGISGSLNEVAYIFNSKEPNNFGFLGLAILQGRTIYTNSIANKHEKYNWKFDDIPSVLQHNNLTIPIMNSRLPFHVSGALQVINKDSSKHGFNDADINFLKSVGAVLALAFENISLSSKSRFQKKQKEAIAKNLAKLNSVIDC